MGCDNRVDVLCGFGAVGDGTTDDTAAIQAAINAAGNGGVVVFPANKTFKITSTLTAPYSEHTWLMWGTTLSMQANGIAVQMGSYKIQPFGVTNMSVYGGTLIGQGPNATGWAAGNIGWQWLNVSHFHHVDYEISGFNIGQQLRGGGPDMGSCAISVANPAVVTKTSHGLTGGDIVYFNFTAGGSLPAPLTVNTPYYVLTTTTNSFTFSASSGGPAVQTTTAGSLTTISYSYGHGIQYGHLVPRHIISNRTGIDCYADNDGWCNENAFFGAGRVGNFSSDLSAAAGDFKIRLDRGANFIPTQINVLNNNKFYGIALEDGRSPSTMPPQASQAIYCNAANCLFDYLRYEGNAAKIIDNSGGDFVDGGNVFRGGVGLLNASTDLMLPGTGNYQFFGLQSNLIQGDSAASLDHALVVRDNNSSGNVAFSVQNVGGTADEFTVTGTGNTQIGNTFTSLGAKLGILNPTTSQIGIALSQVANATVPAVQVTDSSGTPVVKIKKNQNVSAAETDINMTVGTATTGLATVLDAIPMSSVVACGQTATLGAIGTVGMGGQPGGTLILGQDIGSAANGFIGSIFAAANDGTGTLAAVPVMVTYADGGWSSGVNPTGVILFTMSSGGSANGILQANSSGDIGFFGTTPAAQPAPSGSCGNAVLHALCQALGKTSGLGLIDDSSITP